MCTEVWAGCSSPLSRQRSPRNKNNMREFSRPHLHSECRPPFFQSPWKKDENLELLLENLPAPGRPPSLVLHLSYKNNFSTPLFREFLNQSGSKRATILSAFLEVAVISPERE
ncbi:hypothetical protein LR48_Vigan10g232500 [Vigna angularis]|uniref:Uncharacterized protein n=1 Tax=Phaseolus angularis TaxID=3914 RepID=A0A0L9VN97_PHAAN|nr:hypothetical protein LR48_Vigan10g232500 [Vigna angularis]